MDGDAFDSLLREWGESGYHVFRADLFSALLDAADVGCDGRGGPELTEEQAEIIGVSPSDGVDQFLACFVVLGRNIERRERDEAEADEEIDTGHTTGILWARRAATPETAASLKASFAQHGVDAWSLKKLAAAIGVSIDELFGEFADVTRRHAVHFTEAAIAAYDARPLTEANRARLQAASYNRAPGIAEAAKAQGLREGQRGSAA